MNAKKGKTPRPGPSVLLGRVLKEKGLTVAVAESCTGGLLSSMITDVAGSSVYYIGSVVAYSNAVKEKTLGVSRETLEKRGAVSRECAAEMAEGVRKKFHGDTAISITGIAGPGGGSQKKPVGTVFIGVSIKGKVFIKKFLFKGTRIAVKRQAALSALALLTGRL